MVIPRLRGRQNEEFLFNGYRVLTWDDGKVLEMDSHPGYTTM